MLNIIIYVVSCFWYFMPPTNWQLSDITSSFVSWIGEDTTKLCRLLFFCISLPLDRWVYNSQYCGFKYMGPFFVWWRVLSDINLTAAEEKQKNIDIETICELLNLVLGPQFRRQVDLLIDYLKVSGQYAIYFTFLYWNSSDYWCVCR